MRGKGSRGKASLQKTASSIINIHTHRHSSISDTLPLYYNDSLVSIRTHSYAQRPGAASLKHPPRDQRKQEEDKNRKRKGSRENSKLKNCKNSSLKKKDRQLYQLYSE
jgi:hypothetical protein